MNRGFLVTVEELDANPWKLDAKMRNLANINIWKDHYHGKRVSNGIKIKPWRDKIEEIEREIKQKQKDAIRKRKEIAQQKEREEREQAAFAKFHEKILQFHHSLVDKCNRYNERNLVVDTTEHENFMAVAGRAIGNDIHDLPEVKTGLMTLECFNVKENTSIRKFQSTAEHFWPRSTIGGRDLIELCLSMESKFNIRHTIQTLYELCQTIEALDTENRTLMQYQKADTFISPQAAYDSAGIKLVRVKPFALPTGWAMLFDKYGIASDNREPYDFTGVITPEEAILLIEEKRKHASLT